MNKEQTKALQEFMELATQSGIGFANFFGGMLKTETPYPHERLSDGYELRKIDMVDEKGNPVENRDSYSHLYHNDLKVSDLVFRKGGLGGNFKDGYCSLVLYTQTRPHEEKSHGFDFGVHVIINKLGDVCLSGTGMSSYPSHCGGNLGKLKDTYYNLCTGEEVITCNSSGASIDGQRFMIVEHRYHWYNKNLPLGIYKIDKFTCEFEKIDEAKK
jgi:hypothetical protein